MAHNFFYKKEKRQTNRNNDFFAIRFEITTDFLNETIQMDLMWGWFENDDELTETTLFIRDGN